MELAFTYQMRFFSGLIRDKDTLHMLIRATQGQAPGEHQLPHR